MIETITLYAEAFQHFAMGALMMSLTIMLVLVTIGVIVFSWLAFWKIIQKIFWDPY